MQPRSQSRMQSWLCSRRDSRIYVLRDWVHLKLTFPKSPAQNLYFCGEQPPRRMLFHGERLRNRSQADPQTWAPWWDGDAQVTGTLSHSVLRGASFGFLEEGRTPFFMSFLPSAEEEETTISIIRQHQVTVCNSSVSSKRGTRNA